MCKAIEDLYNSGVDAGIKREIYAFIEACKEIGLERETAFLKLQEKFLVTEEKDLEYMEKYSN